MIRSLMHLLGKTDYEPNETVAILKEQLRISNEEKRELYETLLQLVKPEVVHQAQPTLVQPQAVFQRFSQRRASLERARANASEVREKSSFIAKPSNEETKPESTGVTEVKPETVDEMEKRLGLTSEGVVNE